MENALKVDFTRRLSQCNKGEMIVIMYEIEFAYLDDAKKAKEQSDHKAYKCAIQNAQNVLEELAKALDHSYAISKNLYGLYVYCRNLLAKAMYQNKIAPILEAENILSRLYSSFQEAAKQDNSGPLMRNTQQIYAGMTYGKTKLNENDMNFNSQRGFFV